jgi:hypothetical protein
VILIASVSEGAHSETAIFQISIPSSREEPNTWEEPHPGDLSRNLYEAWDVKGAFGVEPGQAGSKSKRVNTRGWF